MTNTGSISVRGVKFHRDRLPDRFHFLIVERLVPSLKIHYCSRWWRVRSCGPSSESFCRRGKRGNRRGHMTGATRMRNWKGNINHSLRRPRAFFTPPTPLPSVILSARYLFILYSTHTSQEHGNQKEGIPSTPIRHRR